MKREKDSYSVMTDLEYEYRVFVWQRARKMLLWNFARAVYRAIYHFCAGKGIRGGVSRPSHSEFTALQPVLATEQGRGARQELLIPSFFLQLRLQPEFQCLALMQNV